MGTKSAESSHNQRWRLPITNEKDMLIFDGHELASLELTAPTIALGNFDGVHKGHQELLRYAKQLAATNSEQSSPSNNQAGVMTFSPHPAKVLAGKAPSKICSMVRKKQLLRNYGADFCIIESFTRAFAQITAEDFIKDILVNRCCVRNIVVGYDFTFGKDRQGNADLLREASKKFGFGLKVVAPVTTQDGQEISSSRIRALLAEGKAKQCTELLGHPYDMEGRVIRGDGRGKKIGVPTANIKTDIDLILATGVYAVQIDIPEEETPHYGVANLGKRPTFHKNDAIGLEVHLFDFDKDLYGKTLQVMFVERIRNEKTFRSPTELVSQINEDIEQAKLCFQTQREQIKGEIQ